MIKWGDDSNGGDSPLAMIQQANTVKFTQVCKHYGIQIDEYNKKIQCPFKFHQDKGPSFLYYPATNSFYCWGCKNGGGPVQFVSLLEDMSKTAAATKLLSNFSSETVDPKLFVNAFEHHDLYLKFSSMIREFIHKNNNPQAFAFIEKISMSFDTVTQRHAIDNEGLKLLVSKLEVRINSYETT